MSNWLTLPQVAAGGDEANKSDTTIIGRTSAARHSRAAPATWEASAEVAQEVRKHQQQQQQQQRVQVDQQQEQTQLEAQQQQVQHHGPVIASDEMRTNGPAIIEHKMPGSGGSADSTYVMRYVLAYVKSLSWCVMVAHYAIESLSSSPFCWWHYCSCCSFSLCCYPLYCMPPSTFDTDDATPCIIVCASPCSFSSECSAAARTLLFQ